MLYDGAVTTETNSPVDAQGQSAAPAFEVVTLLPGFTVLSKRSGELNGTLPVRAARYCGPVFEGSAAGLQITLTQPMTVSRNRARQIACDMTPPILHLMTDEIDRALEQGIGAGLFTRGGFWHRLLKGDAMPVRGNRMLIWTGHMVRPRPGLWLLIGGAFNRRSRVSVVDHLVTDPHHFAPLIVELDLRDQGRQPTWLEGDLGCVTPLSPDARVEKQPLRAGAPELKQFGSFFSEEYFNTKANHPTATYVRRQREQRVKAAPTCTARMLVAGPDVHTVQTFDRFMTTEGFSKNPVVPGTLQFGLVRNFAPTRWTWQGQTHSVFEVKKERHVPALTALWKETFGDGSASGLEFMSGLFIGEMWDQPYVQFQPWVLTATSPGWSMLVDGVHRVPAYDGMRAVIATDWFFALAMVYRIFGPSTAHIPYRAPMLRALPVPRWVLDLDVKQSTL